MNALLPVVVRPALAADQAAITQLVHSERLNPHGLLWQRFVVAVAGDALVGAVQMREHADGSRELGSLVVHPAYRGRGIAPRLIEALLARHPGPVHLVTRRSRIGWFARWGFAAIDARRAPRALRRNRLLGQMASLLALLSLRWPRRLAILQRA